MSARSSKTQRPSSDPPGPVTLSPFGVAAEFRRDPLGLVSDIFRTYGDVALVPGLPGQRIYLINDPTMVREILVAHADKVEKPRAVKRIFRSSFGDGLFFSERELWKRQRKLAGPAFHADRIEGYAAEMVHQAEVMMGAWQDGEVRDLEKDLSATALRIVVRTLFGSRLEDDADAIESAVTELGSIIADQTGNPLLAFLPDWAPLPILARKRRASATLDAVLYRIIGSRRGNRAEGDDLLSMLLQAADEHGQPMSDRQLHDEVMTIFIAGHETTGLALAWALILLARSPEAAARLRAEVDEVLGDRRPGPADLPRLVATESVVKEALRLYPPAWLILRQAREPIDLGTWCFPARSYLWISPYTLHRHPVYYDDPNTFRPERFDPGPGGVRLDARLPKGAYIPFGVGPRTCIGNNFALMEARLLLAAIVRRFELTLPDDAAVRPRAGATLGFESGAPTRITVRAS